MILVCEDVEMKPGPFIHPFYLPSVLSTEFGIQSIPFLGQPVLAWSGPCLSSCLVLSHFSSLHHAPASWATFYFLNTLSLSIQGHLLLLCWTFCLGHSYPSSWPGWLLLIQGSGHMPVTQAFPSHSITLWCHRSLQLLSKNYFHLLG
jgi:hypothetical protein